MKLSLLPAAILASLAIAAAAPLAPADTVTLTTGETLTGTSQGQADGKLRFTHPVLASTPSTNPKPTATPTTWTSRPTARWCSSSEPRPL